MYSKCETVEKNVLQKFLENKQLKRGPLAIFPKQL